MKILDAHVHHLWHDLANRPDDAIEKTKKYAAHWGIRRILMLTLGIGVTPKEARERNSCTLQLMQEDPYLFLGGCWLNPLHDVSFTREEAKRCVQAGMVAIKLHQSLNARDHRHDVIAELAAELDVPIVFHSFYNNLGGPTTESNASDIAYLAERHPETRIVMAHLPGARWRGVLEVADLPNVWVDTCGGWPESAIMEYAVKQLGADRLIYGSDWFGSQWHGRDIAPQLGRVLGADISEADKEKILWKNAHTVLKLRDAKEGEA